MGSQGTEKTRRELIRTKDDEVPRDTLSTRNSLKVRLSTVPAGGFGEGVDVDAADYFVGLALFLAGAFS